MLSNGSLLLITCIFQLSQYFLGEQLKELFAMFPNNFFCSTLNESVTLSVLDGTKRYLSREIEQRRTEPGD